MLKRIIFLFFLILSASLLLISCKKEETKFVIAFSQCTSNDLWRQTMNREMEREVSFYEHVELHIYDAEGNSERQVKQLELLLSKRIDLLIISPNESAPITPVAVKAFEKGIPTIIIDRKIDSEKYTAFIGANNYEIGKSLGKYLGKIQKGKGRIFEIRGLEGSSPARDRHNGFVDALQEFRDMRIVASVDGKWNKNDAQECMRTQTSAFNIVFGHNDVMALGAQEVASKQGRDSLYFIGIDALPKLGIELVQDGILDASFIYPTGGDKAIELAMKILKNESFDKNTTLATAVVDSSNAHVLQLQYEQVLSYQTQIERQIERLAEQKLKYNNQRSLLNIFIISIVLLVVFALALFYTYFITYQQKHELEDKNKAIEKQKEQLEIQNEEIRKMNKKVEAATQAKIRFFTNISHEIRTPITLIKVPLENILKKLKPEQVSLNHELDMIHRNADRLLRLVNQLMDFRKVELGKIDLQVCQGDIVTFLRKIYESFEVLAEKKNMEFVFTAPHQPVQMWFDGDKIDKAIFNLLSNAFKFTPNGGKIELKISEQKENLLIEVIDNGEGIAQEKQEKIFQRFYQQKGHQHMGTGIGLSLCTEFVSLHGGELKLDSEPKKGSKFSVVLPYGNSHFQEQQISALQIVPEQKETYEEKSPPKKVEFPTTKDATILLVEDDEDLREYIRNMLNDEYNLWEAGNGREALKRIEEEHPDLILTDVMMPDMDGLELSQHLKGNNSTNHIPLVMLTARAAQEQKIEGIEMGAEAYIEKPFNPEYLKVRIRKLLEGRYILREHFRSEFSLAKVASSPANKQEKSFLEKVTAEVEKEYQNPEFSVEKLSSAANLSRIQLYRKLKALTGFTPNEFINKFRLQKATFLLEQGELNITEIAYEVGYSSHAYFSKRFKEVYECTPSEFVKRT